MQPLDHSAYLARIGLSERTTPDVDTLARLQFAHLCTVPYENLDILDRIPLSLSIPDLYNKIVIRRRGGYCFELNALFSWLLRSLGYEVVDCFARFLLDEPTIPMRRHHVLIVTAPGVAERYVADVGVGVGSPNLPVMLAYGTDQPQGRVRYRFDLDAFLGWVLKVDTGRGYKPLYSFTEEPQLPVDFTATSFYCEHAPASPFRGAPMVALRTPTGRYTLDGDTFKHFDGDDVRTWTEDTPEQTNATLARIFGIVR